MATPNYTRLEEIKSRLPDEVMRYIDAWEKDYDEPLNWKVAELVLALNDRGIRTVLSWGDDRIRVLIKTPFILSKPLPDDWGLIGWKHKIENCMLLYKRDDGMVMQEEAEKIAGCFKKHRSLFGIIPLCR